MWWSTAVGCCLGVALAGPEWLPEGWTREDGPFEWATFAAFLIGSMATVVVALHSREHRWERVAALALGAALLFAAGEEISWGQRLFDVETPQVLIDGNRQDELNLHNIDGLQGKAIIAQLAIAGIGVLLPRHVPRRWGRIGFGCFAGYLAYRAGRGVAAVAGWGPADRNSEAAELLLATGLLALALAWAWETRATSRRSGVATSP